MPLRYLPPIIPVALGTYLGLTWNTAPFKFHQQGSFPFKYEVLTPALVKDIEEMRQRWDIGGVSIAVVKQDDGEEYDQWKADTFGLGDADWTGAEDGMAFAGNAWGAGLGVAPSNPWANGGLKKNAEVWFDKV
ncbi:hypothetical protein QFC21_007092 [Naganishia friedmannii]|uniref:Uncharacterized protein n=1 Tax=Naganishia friedmannii TaxID=89922 RepID=A0ACC2UXW8_9TREE|nr:hypothetical protein QFC21_007092 [Naganishia friedmannii]